MEGRGHTEKTITERLRVIRQISRETGVHPLAFDTDTLTGWQARLPSQSTRVTYHRTVVAFHLWLLRTGKRPDDPSIDVPRPMERRRKKLPATTEGVARLLASRRYYRTTRGMILLACYQGFRCCEIARMDSALIDRDNRTVEVLRKGMKVEHVPLHPVIERWAEHYPEPGPWFPSPRRGGTVSPTSVSRQISEAMDRCDVRGTAHSLRRWFATTLVGAGVDLITVQELLGHEQLATTQAYVSTNSAAMRDAVLRLPDLTGGHL
jgi:integrase/recombinase XerD